MSQSVYLDKGVEGIERSNGLGSGSSACVGVLAFGVEISVFNGLEEFGGGLLLFRGFGEVLHGTAGLVHVTIEFVADFEPLLLLDVSIQTSEALLGLGEYGLLLGNSLGTGLVKRVRTGFLVNRVRRVILGGLIGTVSGTFRVGSRVSDQTKDRESRGFTDSGVGSDGEEGGTGSGGTLEGFTAGSFLCFV